MSGHIKSIREWNVQSHEDTTMNFHPGVNAIVGITDSGKSAFFRGIVWAITNKNGKGLRSRWGGETAVEIVYNDVTVTRAVDKGNAYELSTIAEPFVAFKTDIPFAVSEAINMDEINLQTQMDSPFLLSADTSAGDVAKVLNKIANLTSIDTAVSNIHKKSLSISRDIVSAQEQYKKLEEQEKSFDYLPQMEIDVESWQNLQKKKSLCVKRKIDLITLLSDIERDQEDIEEISHLLSSEKLVDSAILLTTKQKECQESARKLASIICDIESQVKEIASLENLFEIEEELDSVLELLEDQNETQNTISALSKLIYQIERQDQQATNLQMEEITLEREFKRTFPKICPLCER
jgi:DNA repair protein SbcC/Rad50